MANKYKLIKEYPGSRKIGYISDCCTSVNSEHYLDGNWFDPALYPEYWEKVVEKDYEVLQYMGIYNKSILGYGDPFVLNSSIPWEHKNLEIYKIKRLSDGEILTIGDICDGTSYERRPILEFKIADNTLSIRQEFGHTKLSNLKKSKTPLFTTKDGVAKFDGDMCYYITPNLISIGYGEVVAGSEFKMALARFHDQYKAKVWVEENKPQFSKKDMISFAGYSRGISGSTTTPKCLEHWLESPYNTKK